MATGDAAAAAGYDLVPSTDPVRNGANEHNKTRDYIAALITRIEVLEDAVLNGSLTPDSL